MMNGVLHLLFFLSPFLGVHMQTSSSTTVNNLILELFQNYDKRTRPLNDQSQTLNLDVGFYISIINGIDEVNEKLTTTGTLYITWTDENLQWDPATKNVDNLYLHQNDIWKPDLVLKNGFTKFEEMGGYFYYVSVSPTGYVFWKPYEVLETRCSIDITYFPYDKQTCEIIFIVWSYSVYEVSIQKSTNGIGFFEFEENSVWTVVDTSSEINKDKWESEIVFTIELERKPKYFVLNMIVPVMCLGLLGLLVFIIPVDAGEKMSYSITVFLSFAVFLSIISAGLPVNSESTSILSLYLIIQMAIGTLILVISAIQLRLHHRKSSKNMSQIYIKLVKFDHILRCKSRCGCRGKVSASDDKNEKNAIEVRPEKEEDKNEEPEIEWSDVTSALDFFSFIIFGLSNIAITCYLFITITYQ